MSSRSIEGAKRPINEAAGGANRRLLWGCEGRIAAMKYAGWDSSSRDLPQRSRWCCRRSFAASIQLALPVADGPAEQLREAGDVTNVASGRSRLSISEPPVGGQGGPPNPGCRSPVACQLFRPATGSAVRAAATWYLELAQPAAAISAAAVGSSSRYRTDSFARPWVVAAAGFCGHRRTSGTPTRSPVWVAHLVPAGGWRRLFHRVREYFRDAYCDAATERISRL